MRVVVTLDGTFTAEKMTPVALRPEEWSQFEIVDIVDHGSEVHAGQTLVKFDTEKFDQELAELQLRLNVSELAIRKAEEDLPRLEKTLTLAATDAERNDKNAHEDFDRFNKIERPMLLKSVEYSLKSAQFQLDYAQDELNQLEKMYEADDLTEETEEIVLKRSRTEVDFAKFNLEQTKQYCDEILTVRLPRFDVEIKESLDKSALSLAQARSALAIDVNRARYELEQQREARTKMLDRHAKLLADRALMELKAPADGIVYYGECEDGNWPDMSAMISKLKPHANVSANTVLMTIVERRPLEVTTQVGEAERPEFSVGQAAKVVPPLESAELAPGQAQERHGGAGRQRKIQCGIRPHRKRRPRLDRRRHELQGEGHDLRQGRRPGRSQEGRPHRQRGRGIEICLAGRSERCRGQASTPRRENRQDQRRQRRNHERT